MAVYFAQLPTGAIKILCVCVLIIAVCGCDASPRFDATSEATRIESVRLMTERMNDEQKLDFCRDYTTVMFKQIDWSLIGEPEDVRERRMFAPIDGMTAKQIRALAQRIGQEGGEK